MDSGSSTVDEGVYSCWLPIDINAFDFTNDEVLESSVTYLHGFGLPTGMVLNI